MRLPFIDPPREEVAAVASDLITRFGRFDDDVGRAGNEIVRFQKPINRGLQDKVFLLAVKRTASSRGLSSG